MLKQPLSYEEQIDHLKNHHQLNISDEDKAKEILSKVNYYRLMGYGIGLTQPTNSELYSENITLEHIFQLYCFDSQLRNNLIRTLEQLEIQLKTQIAYLLGTQYGAEGYRNVNNFSDIISSSKGSIHEYTINKIDKMISKNQYAPAIKHHMNKYDSHFPIWLAIEYCTFGNLSSLFEILQPKDKKSIAELYNTYPSYLSNWIRVLVEIRNKCAHYNRIYNIAFQCTPRLYKEHKKYYSKSQPRLFPLLLVIKRMLDNNDQWKSLYKDICQTFEKYQGIPNLSYLEFPSNWQEILSK